MMQFVVIVLLLAWTAVSLVSGHAVPQNCSARYQSALREALEIKSECGDAPAYDCCQVNCNFKTLSICRLYLPCKFFTEKCSSYCIHCIARPAHNDRASATAIAADGLSTMRIHVCPAFTIRKLNSPRTCRL